MLVLSLLALSSASTAGSRWLSNDGFSDGDTVAAQGGFVMGECWGSVFTPDASDYPFEFSKVRMIVGGSTSAYIFTIGFYELSGTDIGEGTLVGSEGIYMTGSDTSWNEVTVSDLKLYMSPVKSGNVAVEVCLEEHNGYPAIARDTDGLAYASRNQIYADAGLGYDWYQSALFGLTGDWIMRLCVTGDGVADEPCDEPVDSGGEGDTDTDTDSDTDTDADTDADTDTDTDADTDADTDTDTDPVTLSLLSITPSSAGYGVAADVVLIGTGFIQGSEARIGGIPLVGQSIVGEETIQGRTPTTLPVGVHDVEVVADDGTSSLLPSGFTVTEIADEPVEPDGCGCATGGGPRGSLVLGLLSLVGLGLVRRRRA